jgi:hypothetical protein
MLEPMESCDRLARSIQHGPQNLTKRCRSVVTNLEGIVSRNEAEVPQTECSQYHTDYTALRLPLGGTRFHSVRRRVAATVAIHRHFFKNYIQSSEQVA